MLIIIAILVWLLISAWLTIWSFGRDLGFTAAENWLLTICSCLFEPIILFIVYPIKDIIREKEIKQRLKEKK